MITTNVLQRTFHLKHGEKSGTCFTIDVDDRQYIVTARHVVKEIRPSDLVQIQHDRIWKNLKTTIAWMSETEEDVAILSPEVQLSPTHPLVPSTAGLVLGQDIYFCGFPFGLRFEAGDLNRDFPIPFVKKGILSAFASKYECPARIYIDGHNNPGFSGGPLIFSDLNTKELKVAGVISGYRPTYEPVLLKGDDIGLMSQQNTGIAIAYDLKRGVEYIRQNPSGVELSV